MFALYSSGKDRRFDDFAFLTNDSSIQQFMYVPLLSMHWLDQPTTQKFLAPILDKKGSPGRVEPEYAVSPMHGHLFCGQRRLRR